jgi:hypothetical protein
VLVIVSRTHRRISLSLYFDSLFFFLLRTPHFSLSADLREFSTLQVASPSLPSTGTAAELPPDIKATWLPLSLSLFENFLAFEPTVFFFFFFFFLIPSRNDFLVSFLHQKRSRVSDLACLLFFFSFSLKPLGSSFLPSFSTSIFLLPPCLCPPPHPHFHPHFDPWSCPYPRFTLALAFVPLLESSCFCPLVRLMTSKPGSSSVTAQHSFRDLRLTLSLRISHCS